MNYRNSLLTPFYYIALPITMNFRAWGRAVLLLYPRLIVNIVWLYRLVLDLLAPIFLALANVGLVAELSHLLSLGEELVSFLRECLLYRKIANLTEKEVAEVLPLRSLRIECERIFALVSQQWVETPQVPVATINGELLLVL